jgi:hypothetical protein
MWYHNFNKQGCRTHRHTILINHGFKPCLSKSGIAEESVVEITSQTWHHSFPYVVEAVPQRWYTKILSLQKNYCPDDGLRNSKIDFSTSALSASEILPILLMGDLYRGRGQRLYNTQ